MKGRIRGTSGDGDRMKAAALLGDIGGTNSRFARVDPGAGSDSAIRDSLLIRNDDFPDTRALFDHVLGQFGPVDQAVIAAAGPVRGGRVALANRDWQLDQAELQARIGGPVRLMNDLAAHVLAVTDLGPGDARILRGPKADQPGNGQWLVVNLGTGFNAGLGLHVAGRPVSPAAEWGMTALPRPVAQVLEAEGLTPPAMLDDLFSGRGLSWLGNQVTDPQGVMTRALARMLQVLITGTLPLDGVHLCGGVAAALFPATGPQDTTRQLIGALNGADYRYPFLRHVPVAILDAPDVALIGCRAALPRD